MFCNQCQETAKNTACTIKGVCGKTEETANLQDLLLFASQGLAYLTVEARKQGIDTNMQSKHIVNNLFMTITNANFDEKIILKAVKETLRYRNELNQKLSLSVKHPSVVWQPSSESDYYDKATEIGTLSLDSDEDIRVLKQYVLYGLKGMAAYAEHAFNLGFEEQDIFDFTEQTLLMLTQPIALNDALNWLVRTGEYGVKVMALLDKANTSALES
jgi:hydroxylamine reductase